MLIETPAIICAVRHHAEHGAIVRVMTPNHGFLVGYVRGGRSRTIRPVLIPSNLVHCTFRARTTDQLASLTVELLHSRGPLMAEPLPSAAIDWVTALTASAVPEGYADAPIYAALDGVLSAIEAAPAARGWALALAGYERLLLASMGYGGRAPTVIDPDAQWADIIEAYRLGRTPLERYVFDARARDVLAARDRLVERMKRAVA